MQVWLLLFGCSFEGELESTIAELEESNCKLVTLKAERDAAKGAFFPVLNLGSKHVAGDKARDKQKDLHDMEATLKELLVKFFYIFLVHELTRLKGLSVSTGFSPFTGSIFISPTRIEGSLWGEDRNIEAVI